MRVGAVWFVHGTTRRPLWLEQSEQDLTGQNENQGGTGAQFYKLCN